MNRNDAARLIRQLRELQQSFLNQLKRFPEHMPMTRSYWSGQADGLELAAKAVRAQVQKDEKDDDAIVILGQGEYEKRIYH